MLECIEKIVVKVKNCTFLLAILPIIGEDTLAQITIKKSTIYTLATHFSYTFL